MITSSRVNNVVVAFTYERRNNLHNSVAPDVLLFRAPPSFVIPTTNSCSSRTCLRSFEKRKQKKFKKYATSAGSTRSLCLPFCDGCLVCSCCYLRPILNPIPKVVKTPIFSLHPPGFLNKVSLTKLWML